MKKIYIVLSQSGSIVSKAIAFKTKKKYNHCSIAFDPYLTSMYSMGRIFPSCPLIGGLVQEQPNVGTYQKFDNTTCVVLSIEVNEYQYFLMQEEVTRMIHQSYRYHYNYLGLLLGNFNIQYQPDNSFMCSEFVRHILVTGHFDTTFLPSIPHPLDYYNLPNAKIEYEGYLNNLGTWEPLAFNE